MIGGLYTAGTAMNMFETSLNTASNNLANINTPGYKRQIVDFQDLVYTGRDGHQIGHGGRAAAITTRDFRQGPSVATENELDVFLSGECFFSVQLANGETAYTRDGTFDRDANGRIVTEDGFVLQPEIVIPEDTIEITINQAGVVAATTSASPDVAVPIGQITLTTFTNKSGLRAVGRNLFQATASAGDVVTGTPGSGVFGALEQKFVEGSNVELTNELTELISSQRAFEVNSRALTTSLELLDSAYEIIR